MKTKCYVKIVSQDFSTVAQLTQLIAEAAGLRAETMKRMDDAYVTFLLPEDRVENKSE